MPAGPSEAFSRAVIDALLKDVGWDVTDGKSVRFEYSLPDGTRADYVLCDRLGRSMAVIEAKRASINPADAAKQGRAYAEQLKVPYVFLSNGRETHFWDYVREGNCPGNPIGRGGVGEMRRTVAKRSAVLARLGGQGAGDGRVFFQLKGSSSEIRLIGCEGRRFRTSAR